jgi:Ala-tRNA(Pro) deacylase
MQAFYEFLETNKTAYAKHDHAAVYMVAEANRRVPPLPAAKTKNLFLRDDKGRRHFLVLLRSNKRVDLKGLKNLLGTKRIR